MVFALALLAFFAIALPDAMLGVAWPFMRISFDQPLAAMTLVLPFGVVSTMASTSAWTWAAARFGLGRLLTGSVVLSAVGLLCCALAPVYGVVVGSAVLFGLSAGAIDSALNAFAARHFGPRRINLMHAAYGLGAATSPAVVTTVVASGLSWRWAYVIIMVVQGGLAVPFAATSHRWTDRAATPGAGPTPGTDTASTTGPATRTDSAGTRTGDETEDRPGKRGGDRSVWRAKAVAGLVLAAVESGLEAVVGLWAFVFLLQGVGVSAATAGAVVSGYWVALVGGRVLLGELAERVGTRPVLAGATIAAAGAAAMIGLHPPVAAAGGVLLLGFAVAPLYPLLVLTTGERTGAGSVDRLVGFQAGASTVGAVVLSGGAGLIMGYDVRGFAGCVLALAALTAAGVWAVRPGAATR
jgi:MFS family permease